MQSLLMVSLLLSCQESIIHTEAGKILWKHKLVYATPLLWDFSLVFHSVWDTPPKSIQFTISCHSAIYSDATSSKSLSLNTLRSNWFPPHFLCFIFLGFSTRYFNMYLSVYLSVTCLRIGDLSLMSITMFLTPGTGVNTVWITNKCVLNKWMNEYSE